MKLSKGEAGILLTAALFAAFTAGWSLRGGGGSQPLRVETERVLEQEKIFLPAPAPTPEREKVNVNTAGVEELKALPGIGEKRAADLIADREENGPYRFPEDITRVKGIGEETLAECLEYITTEDHEP